MKKNILSVSILDDSEIEVLINKNNKLVAEVLHLAALSSFESDNPVLFAHLMLCVENVLASLAPENEEDFVNILTENLAERRKQNSTKEKKVSISIEVPKVKS